MASHRTPADHRQMAIARGRRGISLIETQIAFVVLGIGLAGLCPIVSMHYRQLANLEGNLHDPDDNHATYYTSPGTANAQRDRLQAFIYVHNSPGMQRIVSSPGQTHYIVPWNNPWAQKLTARAQIVPAPWSAAASLDPPAVAPEDPAVTLQSLTRVVDANGSLSGWRATVELQ